MRLLAFVCVAWFAVAPSFAGSGPASGTKKAVPAPPVVEKKQAHQKFVLDVVRMAVALPQSDAQDRLRILETATRVVMPLDAQLAKQFTTEGVRLETQLIAGGARPAVSIFSAGAIDCSLAGPFIDSVPPDGVDRAGESLMAVISACPGGTRVPLRRKLDAALESGYVSARPLLALMEAEGPHSAWSQETFAKMFRSLPKGQEQIFEAPNYAAMLTEMVPAVDKDVAAKAGVSFLEWLGQFNNTSARNLTVNMVMGPLREALGEEKLQEALRSSVVAQGVARSEGQPGEIEHPEEEGVSVLAAMDDHGDQTARLKDLPSSKRAREAAAHGFASGTSGNRKLADKYFDMAYAALDQVWAERSPEKNTPAVVEEVSEAAAQVDAVAALQRAQRLADPSAQAISMLAVARVVGNRD